ncbi:hypothetical protein EVAR_87632_1 [Eumeta japonica]|uniref:Uncharacterized protein n=1 Tax=Eumeta variegata TaxID=151549 RepID=A0A4C1WLQ4_EUMVA|nr:hypothetical protein EVAR_87632_1 [Eumeta japonica]
MGTRGRGRKSRGALILRIASFAGNSEQQFRALYCSEGRVGQVATVDGAPTETMIPKSGNFGVEGWRVIMEWPGVRRGRNKYSMYTLRLAPPRPAPRRAAPPTAQLSRSHILL